MRRKGKKGGDKSVVARHRGRRGNFWGDPGKGSPGAMGSRAAMDAQERTIERRTRRAGRKEIESQLADREGGA